MSLCSESTGRSILAHTGSSNVTAIPTRPLNDADEESPDKYMPAPLKRGLDCRPNKNYANTLQGALVASVQEFPQPTARTADMRQRLRKVVTDAATQKHPSQPLEHSGTISTASLTLDSSIMEVDESSDDEIFDDLPPTPEASRRHATASTLVSCETPQSSSASASCYSPQRGVDVHNATSLTRLTRQVTVNNRGPVMAPSRTTNRVQVHVYDLIHRETVLETPWCDFPIGHCFNTFNDGMHCLGTGAYHAGIEVNGIEYAFGSNQQQGQSGVFICPPKKSPGYQYRTTLDFGQIETSRREWILVPVRMGTGAAPGDHDDTNNNANARTPETTQYKQYATEEGFDETASLHAMSEIWTTPTRFRARSETWMKPSFAGGIAACNKASSSARLVSTTSQTATKQEVTYQYREVKSFVDGKIILQEMAKEYMGVDYDILRKNCCTFVKDACLRLGAEEGKIPTWFLNLAETGVMTEDAVNTVDGYVFSPIRRILSEQCADEEKLKNALTCEQIKNEEDYVSPEGFEIVALSPVQRDSDHYVVNADDDTTQFQLLSYAVGIRTTVSWAY